MDNIKIIKNVINKEEANRIINYTDTNLGSFHKSKFYNRYQLIFGVEDGYFYDMAKPLIHGLEEITDLCKDIVNKSKSILSDEFEDKEKILLSGFWLAKQTAGGGVKLHHDHDGGLNNHFCYSAVLYLNTLADSGVLDFPEIGLSIKPEVGDLVVWPSGIKELSHEVKTINEDRHSIPMWFTKDKNFELDFAGNEKTSS
jgi:hypothetical protein